MVVGLYPFAGPLGDLSRVGSSPKSCWDGLKIHHRLIVLHHFNSLSLLYTAKSCAKVNTHTNRLTEYRKLLTLLCEYKELCRYLWKYFLRCKGGREKSDPDNPEKQGNQFQLCQILMLFTGVS